MMLRCPEVPNIAFGSYWLQRDNVAITRIWVLLATVYILYKFSVAL